MANHRTEFHCKEIASQSPNEKARHYTAADWLKPEKWQGSVFSCTYLACLQNIYPQYILILEHTGGDRSFVSMFLFFFKCDVL